MKNNIEGKVMVITGASSGLGEAAAKHLSEQGAVVVLGARRVDRINAIALIPTFTHSLLKLFTGLAIAAFID